MDILEKIIHTKKPQVERQKQLVPVSVLEQSEFFNRQGFSLKTALQTPGASGIIAEFKRKSPSKGYIKRDADPVEITTGYARAGASGLSVLTDMDFFGGDTTDLIQVRQNNKIPVLRKDFIFDEYQIIEAKSIGADLILLIAEVLTQKEIARFVGLAHSLGLEVLMELHSEEQLEKIIPEIDLIGINNRNLKTFEVSLQNSIDLIGKLPPEFVFVSESGIRNPEDILMLKEYGFQGFLIGESFMKTDNPPQACKNFIDSLR